MRWHGGGGAQPLRLSAEGRVRQLRHDGDRLPGPRGAHGAVPQTAAGRSPAAAARHAAGREALWPGNSLTHTHTHSICVALSIKSGVCVSGELRGV